MSDIKIKLTSILTLCQIVSTICRLILIHRLLIRDAYLLWRVNYSQADTKLEVCKCEQDCLAMTTPSSLAFWIVQTKPWSCHGSTLSKYSQSHTWMLVSMSQWREQLHNGHDSFNHWLRRISSHAYNCIRMTGAIYQAKIECSPIERWLDSTKFDCEQKIIGKLSCLKVAMQVSHVCNRECQQISSCQLRRFLRPAYH